MILSKGLCSSVRGTILLDPDPDFPHSVPVPHLALRYGAEQGQGPLREALAKAFYPNMRVADEIFVSDGSKCDIARIQMMFGAKATVAVQVGVVCSNNRCPTPCFSLHARHTLHCTPNPLVHPIGPLLSRLCRHKRYDGDDRPVQQHGL